MQNQIKIKVIIQITQLYSAFKILNHRMGLYYVPLKTFERSQYEFSKREVV